MTADILMFAADKVPVGEDQVQHLRDRSRYLTEIQPDIR